MHFIFSKAGEALRQHDEGDEHFVDQRARMLFDTQRNELDVQISLWKLCENRALGAIGLAANATEEKFHACYLYAVLTHRKTEASLGINMLETAGPQVGLINCRHAALFGILVDTK